MRERTKFSLGIENEEWVDLLPALKVPLPNDGRCVLVMRTHNGGFRVFTLEHDIHCEHLIMAAAVVRDFIDNYHIR